MSETFKQSAIKIDKSFLLVVLLSVVMYFRFCTRLNPKTLDLLRTKAIGDEIKTTSRVFYLEDYLTTVSIWDQIPRPVNIYY